MIRLFQSPLTATAVVLAGLALLTIPLRRLTHGVAVPTAPAEVPIDSGTLAVSALLRIETVDSLSRLEVRNADGATLVSIGPHPAGESEHEVSVWLDRGGCELLLDFESSKSTAVFLTLMPDGREGLTRYAIGNGHITQPLSFDWPHSR
jgi:hypothetical protein